MSELEKAAEAKKATEEKKKSEEAKKAAEEKKSEETNYADKPSETAIAEPATARLVPQTVESKDGIERIVGSTETNGWQPAPTKTHPDEVKRYEEFVKKSESDRRKRVGEES